MSEETKTQEGAAASGSEFSLVRRILALLKIGDAGKLDSFFRKQVRNLERDVEALEHEKKSIAFEYERQQSTLKEQLEDAKNALSDAFIAVQPEDVADNAKQEVFAERYWRNIDYREADVERIIQRQEDLEKGYKENVEELDEQIAIRKERIASIK